MDYQKSFRIFKKGILSGAMVFLLGGGMGTCGHTIPGVIFTVLGLALVLGAVLQAAIYCHCPYCDYHFSLQKIVRNITVSQNLPLYCPECGRKLESGEEKTHGI